MDKKIFSKCGMRCDLCLIYRPNVKREDRRVEICNAWKKIWQGFSPDPNTVICDGCCSEKEDAVLFSPSCEARKCVIDKGYEHCGYCDQYPCDIFPAEPTEEETFQKIEVEKQWSWEDEKLMEAYACKKYMDEFRKQRCEISLEPMTQVLCHEFFREFENDENLFADMNLFKKYEYDEERANTYFAKQQRDDRIVFMIMLEGHPIGEIKLKDIDLENGECTLSIHMQNDKFKGKGYGTRAEQLAVAYAFDNLKMKKVNADVIHKNKRSQHVLEKLGFQFLREDETFKYYVKWSKENGSI